MSTAVVVGATGAVGGAITRELTRQGVPVLGVGRTADESSLGRLGSIDEVAWIAGLLLDERAAALHGSTISLDGGRLGGIF